jgi:hypothetical protein
VIGRLHLFELEDQVWFPAVLRDLATDYLHFVESEFRLHRQVVPLLADALQRTGSRHVVDLCSGGGGPIPGLQQGLAAQALDVRFTLTDRFPNTLGFRRAQENSGGRITFVADPVDARAVPRDLQGFRTMFNSFHHFRPAHAKAILRDAMEAGQPIGIFEIPERSIRTILPLLLTPLFVEVGTLFIRPFRWQRFLWTNLIPLVPLICLWDGIVSQLRAYTVAELEGLVEDLPSDSYIWHAGKVGIPSTVAHVTYLIGYPR